MARSRKERLALKLVEWPLLRVLIFSPWFRVILVCTVLLVLAFALAIPRLWQSSPAGFAPTVKVSLFDLARVRALKRSAAKLMAAGKAEEAAFAWQQALAYNLADPEVLRGGLRQLLEADRLPPKATGQAVAETFWLLRLTRTNREDVALSATVYDRFGLPQYLVQLLTPLGDKLSIREQGAYLKALFLLERMDEFAAYWAKMGNAVAADPELKWYHATYLAGWGPPGTVRSGREELEAGLSESPQRVLANRLALALNAKLLDLGGYRECLQRLELWHADRLADHVGYWQLLMSVGRRAEAKRLAENYIHPPVMPWEVVRLTQAYLALGMEDYTRRFLRRYAPDFANSEAGWGPEIWALYADLLIRTRQWDELQAMAVQIRLLDNVRVPLASFSLYLEGRALYGLDRSEEAVPLFQQASQLPFYNSQMGLAAGLGLIKMGYPLIAWDVLRPLESELKTNAVYWQGLFDAAYEKKDGDVLFKAAAKAHELRPNDPVCDNNYAAALLIARQRPDEALKLTLTLLQRNPHSLTAVVNHSFALAMNRRSQEAADLLRTVDVKKLNELQATMFYLNWFEIHADSGQPQLAWEDADRIKARYLFPKQVSWLTQRQRQLPPRPEPATKSPVRS